MNFNERARIEIDLDAIEYNYRTIKDRIPEGTKVCCVVKADAYGHGAVRVARLLSEAGVDMSGNFDAYFICFGGERICIFL